MTYVILKPYVHASARGMTLEILGLVEKDTMNVRGGQMFEITLNSKLDWVLELSFLAIIGIEKVKKTDKSKHKSRPESVELFGGREKA